MHLVLLALLVAIASAATDSKCYLRDGTYDNTSQPCDPSAEVSHCCQEDVHLCLSTLLCFDIQFNHLIEATCTDQTWQSDSCAQYCRDTPNLSFWGDVRQCDNSDSAWICGQNSSDCSNNFTIPMGYVNDKRPTTQSAILTLPSPYTNAQAVQTVTTTVSASGSGSAAAATSTGSGSDTANATAICPKDDSTKVGLGAGLGVGIPLLLLLLASLGLLFKEKKHAKQLQQQLHHGGVHMQPTYEKDGGMRTSIPGKPPIETQGQQIHEAPVSVPRNFYESGYRD